MLDFSSNIRIQELYQSLNCPNVVFHGLWFNFFFTSKRIDEIDGFLFIPFWSQLGVSITQPESSGKNSVKSTVPANLSSINSINLGSLKKNKK